MEEQLHLNATKCTSLVLKELFQRVASDIALEANISQYGSMSAVQNSLNTRPSPRPQIKTPSSIIGNGYIDWLQTRDQDLYK